MTGYTRDFTNAMSRSCVIIRLEQLSLRYVTLHLTKLFSLCKSDCSNHVDRRWIILTFLHRNWPNGEFYYTGMDWNKV